MPFLVRDYHPSCPLSAGNGAVVRSRRGGACCLRAVADLSAAGVAGADEIPMPRANVAVEMGGSTLGVRPSAKVSSSGGYYGRAWLLSPSPDRERHLVDSRSVEAVGEPEEGHPRKTPDSARLTVWFPYYSSRRGLWRPWWGASPYPTEAWRPPDIVPEGAWATVMRCYVREDWHWEVQVEREHGEDYWRWEGDSAEADGYIWVWSQPRHRLPAGGGTLRLGGMDTAAGTTYAFIPNAETASAVANGDGAVADLVGLIEAHVAPNVWVEASASESWLGDALPDSEEDEEEENEE